MKKFYTLFCLIASCAVIIFIFNGCATIFGWGGSEMVNIRSKPDQANVTITDENGTKIFEGKTPTSIPLGKKKGYFSGKTYTLKISKDGFSDKIITIDTETNGWYIGGNLVFGGLIGWFIVDPLTGAMWTLDKNDVDVNLESTQQGMLLKSNGSGVILLQDVPNSLRSKMIKITE